MKVRNGFVSNSSSSSFVCFSKLEVLKDVLFRTMQSKDVEELLEKIVTKDVTIGQLKPVIINWIISTFHGSLKCFDISFSSFEHISDNGYCGAWPIACEDSDEVRKIFPDDTSEDITREIGSVLSSIGAVFRNNLDELDSKIILIHKGEF